jgi:hypothetical protein
MKPDMQRDGRQLWLEESIVNASAFLTAMAMAEQKRNLSDRESDMKQLALAFMFLYNVVEEQDLLENVDNFFHNETIH